MPKNAKVKLKYATRPNLFSGSVRKKPKPFDLARAEMSGRIISVGRHPMKPTQTERELIGRAKEKGVTAFENYAQVCEDAHIPRREAVKTIARILVERGAEPEMAMENAELRVMRQYGRRKGRK